MRFHWLRDRVRQGQFRVLFIPGAINIADFFTKALPVIRVDPDDDDDITTLYCNLNVVSLLYDAC
jgi:hypothetical protein